jgi:hypothetical protein
LALYLDRAVSSSGHAPLVAQATIGDADRRERRVPHSAFYKPSKDEALNE